MGAFAADSLDLRRKLAYACRIILAANGQNDTVYGHVSHRQAEAAEYRMKPAAMGLDEITPETLIRLDLDGALLEGDLPRHVEYPIHAEIFRARPAATCVIHTHPPYSIAFDALNQPLVVQRQATSSLPAPPSASALRASRRNTFSPAIWWRPKSSGLGCCATGPFTRKQARNQTSSPSKWAEKWIPA